MDTQTQKSLASQRLTRLLWISLDRNMVEAAGIEPASEDSSTETTTCVVSPMISHPFRHRLTKAEKGQLHKFRLTPRNKSARLACFDVVGAGVAGNTSPNGLPNCLGGQRVRVIVGV